MKYHSALKRIEYFESVKEETYYKVKNSIAFHHDVIKNTGLPKVYSKCDVLYSEPSWSGGIKNFDKRANTKTNYNDYANAINNIIKTTDIPILLIVGVNDSKRLRRPYESHDTTIHDAPAKLNVYNFSYKGPLKDNYAIINHLSEHFNCVGDFSCGYGNTGEIFFKKNKSFVMSDYNKKCIGYIKENICEDL
jgi:hypothetical protein|tara:strand:- start:661 stop:1236 length:576 start_codon:yes stop_codon:yes gene_type:complete